MNWNDASNWCQQMGSRLVVIESKDEQNHIENFINNSQQGISGNVIYLNLSD